MGPLCPCPNSQKPMKKVWERIQGPHDPLLPGGPMSCQSAPAYYVLWKTFSMPSFTQ
ncbi:unnamed protein product [Staurois parvus]|uniref:Uncharacterized protein n=1 Tax=Staurois parvus TaxID=386267 RepID=A0ABN9BDS6_9NEOB|nr:unnamed protein product [Staurois parvus]